MWSFTSYIIWKLHEEVFKARRRQYISLDELSDFIFNTLWRKYHLVLNDSTAELEREVLYLAKLGAVEYDRGRIKVKEKLSKIARAIMASSMNDQLTLYPEYLKKIDLAVEEAKNSYICMQS